MNGLVKTHLKMLTAVVPGCNLRLVMTLSQFLSTSLRMCSNTGNRTTDNVGATNAESARKENFDATRVSQQAHTLLGGGNDVRVDV